MRHISGKLKLLSKVVSLYDFSQDSEETIVDYAIEYLSHNNGEVRAAAYLTLLAVYSKIGAKLRTYFQNMRSQ